MGEGVEGLCVAVWTVPSSIARSANVALRFPWFRRRGRMLRADVPEAGPWPRGEAQDDRP